MTGGTLLICTVGGTPEPVAAAVLGCKPNRIIFVASAETAAQVEASILPLVRGGGSEIDPGQLDVALVSDPQDLSGCVEMMRELGASVEPWLRRGPDCRVIVDFTGGTKCMSAAMALVASRWACQFSYVGGSERTKGGVGVVVRGTERVLHSQNPWDSLGYQTIEQSIALFDGGDYQASARVLDDGIRRVERVDLRGELVALRLLAEAYLSWDLFDHRKARQKLEDVDKKANDLRHMLGSDAHRLLKTIQDHRAFLAGFQNRTLGPHTILDLCANARRCADRGRWDDAVARLYRTFEAAAQLRLRDCHAVADTKRVSLEHVPEPLRSEWTSRARNGGLLLGLQDDYRLLDVLGDELGRRFHQLGLDGRKSPLASRNESILAHGFEPVGQKIFADLWTSALALVNTSDGQLPCFPRLGTEGAREIRDTERR